MYAYNLKLCSLPLLYTIILLLSLENLVNFMSTIDLCQRYHLIKRIYNWASSHCFPIQDDCIVSFNPNLAGATWYLREVKYYTFQFLFASKDLWLAYNITICIELTCYAYFFALLNRNKKIFSVIFVSSSCFATWWFKIFFRNVYVQYAFLIWYLN